MTVQTGGQVRRTDLVHAADYPLVVTGRFGVGGSEFTAHLADEDGLTCLLAAVTRSPVDTSTVRLFLTPKGYHPPQPLPLEYPPSALYFDVDQQHRVAAAGLLVFHHRRRQPPVANPRQRARRRRGAGAGPTQPRLHSFPAGVVHHDPAAAGHRVRVGLRRDPACPGHDLAASVRMGRPVARGLWLSRAPILLALDGPSA